MFEQREEEPPSGIIPRALFSVRDRTPEPCISPRTPNRAGTAVRGPALLPAQLTPRCRRCISWWRRRRLLRSKERTERRRSDFPRHKGATEPLPPAPLLHWGERRVGRSFIGPSRRPARCWRSPATLRSVGGTVRGGAERGGRGQRCRPRAAGPALPRTCPGTRRPAGPAINSLWANSPFA